MRYEPVKSRLKPDELPAGFNYPASFDAYLSPYSKFEANLEPWGATVDAESDARYSELYGARLVQFAQAWLEDMIACFVVGTGDDPRVVVLNPWADKLVDGEWKKTMQILEEFPNFDAWLEWAGNSELVRLHAENRDRRAG
jgi:hypothetical protein